MIVTYEMLLEQLKDYKSPDNKIVRMTGNKEIIKLTKGLYETDKTVAGYLLAGSIYGTSYLSLDYALSLYGLIPERVVEYTSVTSDTGKKKLYKNYFGTYTYRDIPLAAFPYEVKLRKEGEYSYWIASPCKALCDKLYSLKPVKNKSELKSLLFDDLRIDEDEFNKLDKEILLDLCPLYKCTNLKLLRKVIANGF